MTGSRYTCVFLMWVLVFVQVLSLIKSCHEPQGISMQDLKQKLSSMSVTVIRYTPLLGRVSQQKGLLWWALTQRRIWRCSSSFFSFSFSSFKPSKLWEKHVLYFPEEASSIFSHSKVFMWDFELKSHYICISVFFPLFMKLILFLCRNGISRWFCF